MQGDDFAVNHHVDWFFECEFYSRHRYVLRQRMLDVRAVVESWQVADQPQPPDWAPADVLDQTAVDLRSGGDHHRAAGELAVVKSQEEATAPVKVCFAFNSHRKWSPPEPRQREED